MASATPKSFFDDLHAEIRFWSFTDAKIRELLNRANDRFASLAPWRWLCYSEAPVSFTTAQNYNWTPSEAFIHIPMVVMEVEGSIKVIKNSAIVPQTDDTVGLPSTFSWDDSPGGGDYRMSFFPRPTLTGKFITVAKRAHTVITSGNWETADTFEFPDQYGYIYKQFLLAFMHNAVRSSLATQSRIDPQTQQLMGPEALAITYARDIMPFESMLYDEAGRQHQG